MMQDVGTNQEIVDDESEDTGESTSSSDIEEHDLNYPQVVLFLGQVHQNKLFWTTQVPLQKKWSRADSVIARPPLPYSRNPAGTLAPPLL